MDMEAEKALQEVGLSQQEALVYLTTLKLGTAKASTIAQKSEVQRGGAYYTLKLLKEKGFISEVIKSGVLYYSAAPPEKILEIIEEERNKKKETITSILDDLNNIRETAIEKPTIEVYEGYEGFKTMFSKLIEKPNQTFRCYLSSKILDFLPHFHEQFRKRRSKKNISIKTITERTKKLEEIKKLDKKELRQTRFNNELFKNSNSLYYILKDAVVIIKANKQEQVAIYIKERNLAELHKNIFDTLWRKAKE